MLDYIGKAIPYSVAKTLTKEKISVILAETLEAVLITQAVHKDKTPAEKKQIGVSRVVNSFNFLNEVAGGDSATDRYVYETFVPACVDGVVKILEDSLYFDTRKTVEIGGKNASMSTVLPFQVGEVPQTPTPCPEPPEIRTDDLTIQPLCEQE